MQHQHSHAIRLRTALAATLCRAPAQGTEAIRAMYSVVGLGWLSFLMELPFVTQVSWGSWVGRLLNRHA